MKRSFLAAALMPAVILLAGAAYATTWGTVTPMADCDGWSFEGEVHFNTRVSVNVDWEVVLTEGATTVCTYSGTTTVYSTGQGSVVLFSESDTWCEELCGDYNAYGTFYIDAEPYQTAYLDIDFTCECDEPGDVCNYTQGYWKNHEENWPVMSLVVGGVNYSQTQLLQIFRTPPKGDCTYILAHQLIAAMLNVANGSGDTDIADEIDDANAWLMMYPIGSDPEDCYDAIDLSEELDMWNNLHCDEEDDDDMMDSKAREGLRNKSSAENATWGSIKGLYGK